jgi:hypothetical protein
MFSMRESLADESGRDKSRNGVPAARTPPRTRENILMWYRDFFPRSRPRQAKGGIKSQSKRGAFGASWWAKRWIAVLESFNIGARLARGRSWLTSTAAAPVGWFRLDPAKLSARHDAQVKAALKGNAFALVILGAAHDLSESIPRHVGSCEYLRVTTERYREFAGEE